MELTERETEKGLFASGVVTALCWALISVFVLALAGCSYQLQNDGEAGFKYSTSFAFFHTAKKTTGGAEDDIAKSSTEFPALVEWWLEGPPPPPVETRTTTTVTKGTPEVSTTVTERKPMVGPPPK